MSTSSKVDTSIFEDRRQKHRSINVCELRRGGGGLHFTAFINPRRACAERVTVVVSCVCVCVCMYVCLSEHAILAVHAIKDAIVLSIRFAAMLKRRFS